LALSEVLAIALRMRCVDEYPLLKAGPDGDLYTSRERCSGRCRRLQRRALSALCSPCSRPSRQLSGPPSSASSPFPYPYRVIGMVMIAFVGVATFDKPGTGATSILQSVVWVSPKRQLRNATLAPSCSYYASCAAARGAAVGALGSQTVVMPCRISRHTGFYPHSSKTFRQ
jgi:hypothetical protein